MLDQKRLYISYTFGPVLGYTSGNFNRPVDQLSGRHQVVDEADMVCLVGKDFPPTVKQFFGLGPPNHGRQAPGGVQLAVVDRQESEAAFFTTHEKIQASCHDSATTIAEAVNSAYDGFGRRSHMPGVVSAGSSACGPLLIVVLPVLMDVCACGERPIPSTRNHDSPDVVVLLCLSYEFIQLTH